MSLTRNQSACGFLTAFWENALRLPMSCSLLLVFSRLHAGVEHVMRY